MRKPTKSRELRGASLFATAISRLLYSEATGRGVVELQTATQDAAGLACAIGKRWGATAGERRLLPRVCAELLEREAVVIVDSSTIMLDAATRRESDARSVASPRNRSDHAGIFSADHAGDARRREPVAKSDATSRNHSDHADNSAAIPLADDRRREPVAKSDATSRNHKSDDDNYRAFQRGDGSGRGREQLSDATSEPSPRNDSPRGAIKAHEIAGTTVALSSNISEEEKLFLRLEGSIVSGLSEGAGWATDPTSVCRVLEAASDGAILLRPQGAADPLMARLLRALLVERPSLPAELLWWAALARDGADEWSHGDRVRARLLGSAGPDGELQAKGLRRCLDVAAGARSSWRAQSRAAKRTEERALSQAQAAPPIVPRAMPMAQIERARARVAELKLAIAPAEDTEAET